MQFSYDRDDLFRPFSRSNLWQDSSYEAFPKKVRHSWIARIGLHTVPVNRFVTETGGLDLAFSPHQGIDRWILDTTKPCCKAYPIAGQNRCAGPVQT